ncbi:response regulator transcription factor [Paenibacillus sp. y28]|uniref:response regulator transcription factor n=1 Tax=Paenibacillus sp. y28 TaxID=3129110 RepID=UPI003015A8B3
MHKVLLVDDERWIRTSIRHVLEKTGLPLEIAMECGNGLEALDWLKGHEADLVLTDVRMPVMDGITFVRQLREQGKEQGIIVISGYDEFAYVQAALRCGVFDYLLKPVEVEDMAACLTKWLRSRTQEPPAEHRPAAGAADSSELSAVEQVIRYIRDRLPGDVTLQEAAARVHLNPSYLSQLFKQQMKVNFVDYVLALRMEEAKRLLVCTSLRISEIADRLGYADLSYFSNTFKRFTAQTPSEYRRERKEARV